MIFRRFWIALFIIALCLPAGQALLAAKGYVIVDAQTGATRYQGTLTLRQDVGYLYSPTPYQNVYQADFSSFTTPGQYRVLVPGMGASLPFRIDEGIAMDFTRTLFRD